MVKPDGELFSATAVEEPDRSAFSSTGPGEDSGDTGTGTRGADRKLISRGRKYSNLSNAHVSFAMGIVMTKPQHIVQTNSMNGATRKKKAGQ